MLPQVIRETLLSLVSEEANRAVGLRHQLHANPELSNHEVGTQRAIAAALEDGAQPVAGTGLLVHAGGRSGPDAVVVRAELDALPLVEQTGASFASTNGSMHACGHDVHSAALVALVRAVRRMSDDLPLPLTALFQPSEEAYPSGAARIVAERALEGGTRAIVSAHVHPDVPWGSVALDPGPINGSSDTITIRVRGRAAHAAYPHTGRDPILALSAIVVALQASVRRRLDPLAPAVLSIGRIRAGETENVIPGTAEARGTLRTLDESTREAAAALAREVVVDTARSYGCEAELDVDRGAPSLVNDETLVAGGRALLAQADLTPAPSWRSLGADDFSFFGAVAPIAMAFVGLAGAPGFTARALHHPEFVPPDEAVGQIAKAQALLYLTAAQGEGAPR